MDQRGGSAEFSMLCNRVVDLYKSLSIDRAVKRKRLQCMVHVD
jgi:hypothetical protein